MKYLPYGDSPTIKSYTRWEAFERALETRGEAVVKGLHPIPCRDLPRDSIWFLEEHRRRLERCFEPLDGEARISSKEGISFVHLDIPLRGRFLLLEDSNSAPLSLTGTLRGKGTFYHVLVGNHPHFSLWRIEGDVKIHTAVLGQDVFLRYRGYGNIEALGASLGGRSDVAHIFEAEESAIVNRHLLLGSEGSFLVHRPLAKVKKGGDAFLETLLVKEGGLVVGVPSVEVLSGRVRGARHAVKDVALTEDQLFYMASRGIGRDEAQALLLRELLRWLLSEEILEVLARNKYHANLNLP